MPAYNQPPRTPRIYRRTGAPVLWLPCDRARRTFRADTGDVYDLIGNSPAGVRSTGCVFANGPFGTCLRFGSSDCPVNFANTPTGATQWTVEAWASFDSLSGNQYLWDLGVNNASVNYNGTLMIGSPSGGMSLGTPATLTPGSWHHYAIRYDGNTASMFFDGAILGSTAALAFDALSTLVLGDYGGGGAYSLVGNLWDFRLYTTAIPQAEIARDMSDPWWRCRTPWPEIETLAAFSESGAINPLLGYLENILLSSVFTTYSDDVLEDIERIWLPSTFN